MQHDNNSSKIPSPLMLSGTHCVEGTGLAIVLAVGDHSQKGIIRRTVDNAQENSQTPLEEKLESIAENIGWFGMGAGIVTLVALTIRFGISYDNHPRLKRILMPESWIGWPLRKDYITPNFYEIQDAH